MILKILGYLIACCILPLGYYIYLEYQMKTNIDETNDMAYDPCQTFNISLFSLLNDQFLSFQENITNITLVIDDEGHIHPISLQDTLFAVADLSQPIYQQLYGAYREERRNSMKNIEEYILYYYDNSACLFSLLNNTQDLLFARLNITAQTFQDNWDLYSDEELYPDIQNKWWSFVDMIIKTRLMRKNVTNKEMTDGLRCIVNYIPKSLEKLTSYKNLILNDMILSGLVSKYSVDHCFPKTKVEEEDIFQNLEIIQKEHMDFELAGLFEDYIRLKKRIDDKGFNAFKKDISPEIEL